MKDSTKFTKGFNDLTPACNACHKAIGRGFIADRLAFQQSIVFAAHQAVGSIRVRSAMRFRVRIDANCPLWVSSGHPHAVSGTAAFYLGAEFGRREVAPATEAVSHAIKGEAACRPRCSSPAGVHVAAG